MKNLKNRNRRPRKQEKKERKIKMSKPCPYPNCGGDMKPRGASNSSGSLSWKCRNKKCGRTVWVHKNPEPPVPLVSSRKY